MPSRDFRKPTTTLPQARGTFTQVRRDLIKSHLLTTIYLTVGTCAKLTIIIFSPPSPQIHAHIYTHTQYYDLAADVLAENSHLVYKCLSTYLYDFIDAKITQQTSAEEVLYGSLFTCIFGG
jgi:hypothetical protein